MLLKRTTMFWFVYGGRWNQSPCTGRRVIASDEKPAPFLVHNARCYSSIAFRYNSSDVILVVKIFFKHKYVRKKVMTKNR